MGRTMPLKFQLVRILAVSMLLSTAGTGLAQPRPDGGDPTAKPSSETADQPLAKRIIEVMDDEESLSFDEARHLLMLSRATWPTKRATIRLALADAESAQRVGNHAAFFVKALVGLDPYGDQSQALFENSLSPIFDDPDTGPETVHAACMLLRNLHMPNRGVAAAAVHERMKIEQDRTAMAALTGTLTLLSYSMDDNAAKQLSATLVQQVEGSSDAHQLIILAGPLAALATRLPPQDSPHLSATLFNRIGTEKDAGVLSDLSRSLSLVALILDPDDVPVLVNALLQRMNTETDSFCAPYSRKVWEP